MKTTAINNQFIVYKHTFPNGKVYIGITCKSFNVRWRKNGSGYIQQKLVWNAIQKYGWNNIKHEILFTNLTLNEASEKEKELIKEYKSNNYKYGYNQSVGGDCSALGNHLKEETKKRISEANKGEKCFWYGKKLPNEMKNKISKSHKGLTAWNKGKPKTETEKLKIFNSSPNKRRIICVQTQIIYESIGEASRKLNLDKTSISKCCKGINKTTKGLKFKYAE